MLDKQQSQSSVGPTILDWRVHPPTVLTVTQFAYAYLEDFREWNLMLMDEPDGAKLALVLAVVDQSQLPDHRIPLISDPLATRSTPLTTTSCGVISTATRRCARFCYDSILENAGLPIGIAFWGYPLGH